MPLKAWRAGDTPAGLSFVHPKETGLVFSFCTLTPDNIMFHFPKSCRLRKTALKSISSDDLFQEKVNVAVRAMHSNQPSNVDVCNPQSVLKRHSETESFLSSSNPFT